MGERVVDGQAAAHGAADECRGLRGRGQLDGAQIVQVAERFGGVARLAEAATVVSDDPMAGRERVELRPPHPPIGYSGMQEDDGVAAPATVVARRALPEGML